VLLNHHHAAAIIGIIGAIFMGCSSGEVRPTATPIVSKTPRIDPTAISEQIDTPVQSGESERNKSVRSEIQLAAPQPRAIRFEILRSVDREAALLLADDGPRTLVRRVAASGVIGDIVVLEDRNVAGLFERERPLLVTSNGQDLCVGALAAARHDDHCRAVRPWLMTTIAGRPALLEERLAVPDDDARDQEAKDTPPKSRPRYTELLVRFIDDDGVIDDKPTETGLRYRRPLRAMGLKGAVGTATGAMLVWFEVHKPKREGRRTIPRAKLRSGRLDSKGRWVENSRSTVFMGERGYGHIEEHYESHLFRHGQRVAYAGRSVKKKRGRTRYGWEAFLLGPSRPIQASNAVFEVAPARLAGPEPVRADEQARYQAIAKKKPRLTPGQSAAEPGRVAWTAGGGFFQSKEALWKVAPDGSNPTELAHPFTVPRERVLWATTTADGEGLVRTQSGWSAVAANGQSRPIVTTGAEQWNDAWQAARIGTSWWVLHDDEKGRGARLLGADTRVPVGPLARLVGGTDRGWVLEQRGGLFSVASLSQTGQLHPLGDYPAAILSTLSTTERSGGGAIVAGFDHGASQGATTWAVDDAGVPQPAWTVANFARSDGPIRLVALPAGGALMFNAAQTRALWLDNDGKPAHEALWPGSAQRTPDQCLDGRPTTSWQPSAVPGVFQSLGNAPCIVNTLQPVASGGLRGFATLAAPDGAQTRAVRVDWPGTTASDAGAARGRVPTTTRRPTPAPSVAPVACPSDMVSVEGRFCIDRFEASLINHITGAPLSPDYPVAKSTTGLVVKAWRGGRWHTGDLHARATPLPPLLRAVDAVVAPRATNRAWAIPSGYVSGRVAASACRNAGKRLCSHDEWSYACRGEDNTKFPYGAAYEPGACNVHRDAHPALQLHGNASTGHLDPRLNRVVATDGPMLRRTGSTPRCVSRWGDDGVYDMVGNLDEWVKLKKGAFAGGFYARRTRKGCGAAITVHPTRYMDYSLTARCCRNPSGQ